MRSQTLLIALAVLFSPDVGKTQVQRPRVIGADFQSNHSGRLIRFSLLQPEQTVVLGSLPAPVFSSGVETLEAQDASSLVLLSSDHRLWRIDTISGVQTEIGVATIPWPQNWAGLGRDPSSGDLFAAANCFSPCVGSWLYRVASDYQSVSLIGAITNMNSVVGIAFDNNGTLYGVDGATDQLFRIDSAAASGTVIGPIGFNANFGQGMDFDRRTDTLYMFAHNFDTSRAELRVVDTATGHSELIGPIGDGSFFTVKGVIDEARAVLEVPTLSPVLQLILGLSLIFAGLYYLEFRAPNPATAPDGWRRR